MCTVSFVSINKNEFVLTSNRDENIQRESALAPAQYTINNIEYTFPKDPKAGGTWVCMTKEKAFCLLNGAFKPHKKKESYKHSRGLIPLRAAEYETAKEFADSYNFNGLEPFTLVMIYPNNAGVELFELVWDEQKVHFKKLDVKQNYLWSSATLYTDEVRRRRREWFAEWQQNTDEYTIENCREFHNFGGKNKGNKDFLIKRDDGIFTQSITSMSNKNGELTMEYLDLYENTLSK